MSKEPSWFNSKKWEVVDKIGPAESFSMAPQLGDLQVSVYTETASGYRAFMYKYLLRRK